MIRDHAGGDEVILLITSDAGLQILEIETDSR
jgi:hypothetical protein